MSKEEIKHLKAIIKLNEEHNISQKKLIDDLKHVLFSIQNFFCH